jgi:23S rRNA pseudouridine1911/1915/1917 synthase
MEPGEIQPNFAEVEFTVETNYAGWRLDKYLRVKIPRLSRTRIQRIIERSVVAEKALKPSSLLSPGLKFRLRKPVLEEPQTPRNFAELHRDEHVLVLDKPAGLPIHPTARYHHGTLVMLLRHRYGEGLQPWPVHRLDRETSGVLVCALNGDVARALMKAFVANQVSKEYLAICEGWPGGAFQVDAPIALGSAQVRIAVRIDASAGKPAVTRFEVLRRFERGGERFALLRARPQTGRQHQIRVHLKKAGFPIVGDKIYGPDEGYFDRFSRRELEPEAWSKLRLPRHALHAARIEFDHPGSSTRVGFESPLPEDLNNFMLG